MVNNPTMYCTKQNKARDKLLLCLRLKCNKNTDLNINGSVEVVNFQRSDVISNLEPSDDSGKEHH